MKKNCTKCKKEIVLQKVKNNFNLCYLCNFDLSDMKELEKLKVEEKTKPKKESLSDKYDRTKGISLVQDDGRVFNNVKVLDFDMEFGTMVIFMVKWAIASIPAMIILFVIGTLLVSIFGISIVTLFK